MTLDRAELLNKAFSSGRYYCLPEGMIISTPKRRGFYLGREKILKPYRTKNGYDMVALSVGGVVKYYLVHQCMAHFFIRPLAIGEEVNHRDGNKQNNNILNLEITDRSGNAQHAYLRGLFKYNRDKHNGRFKRIC